MSTHATLSEAAPGGRYTVSLHHLTALDVTATELVVLAEQLHCQHVCLFTYLPERFAGTFPCISANQEARELAQRMRGGPITVCSIDFFAVEADMDFETCAQGFERGALLGARRATVQVRDEDVTRATTNFVRLCSIAREHGIDVGLEFTGLATIQAIGAAATFLEQADMPNATLTVDALHLFRTGGNTKQLTQHQSRIGYAQLCDGPMMVPAEGYRQEAIGNRAIPGTAEFPLEAFIRRLPAGIPVAIEVPLHRLRDAGVPAAERARRAVEAGQRLLATAITADHQTL